MGIEVGWLLPYAFGIGPLLITDRINAAANAIASCVAVLIQHWLVTDGQTDGQTHC